MSRTAEARRSSPPAIVLALALDALFVVLFAIVGRSSHSLELTAAGIADTAWPFLVGLVVMWAATLAWRAPFAPVRSGLPVWLGTVVIGLLLRALAGGGTALAFVIVAALTLLLLLVGWRLIALIARRR